MRKYRNRVESFFARIDKHRLWTYSQLDVKNTAGAFSVMLNLESLSWQIEQRNPFKMQQLQRRVRTKCSCEFTKTEAKEEKKRMRGYRETLATYLATPNTS